MSDCDKYIELISASLDGACSPAETAELEAHLSQCPTCKALYDDLKTIHDAMSALPAMDPPADLKDRVMSAIAADNVVPLPVKKKTPTPWKRWGATAAAVLLVALGAWGLNQNSGSKDTVPKPESAAVSPGLAMFRSAAVPQPSADPGAMIESYSTDDLNSESQAVEALPPSEVPESQDVPNENQSQGFTGTAANKSAPTVDAASGEVAEPTPVPEPNISLFSALPPSNSIPVPSEAPVLSVGDALDLLLEEKGFEGCERVDDTTATWPRKELWQDYLVYDAISENGRYYVFILFRNVYDSAEDDQPSHNSRCCAYAVALDGSQVLEELSGPEFWEALGQE